MTQRQHSLEIPGKLIHPLGPSVVALARQPTWSLTHSQLDTILTFAWESLSPDTEDIISNLEQVPPLTAAKLPYKDKLGKVAAFQFEKQAGTASVACFICGIRHLVKNMRNHVGHHILYAMRGIDEDACNIDNLGIEPCGFCGRDGCVVQLTKKNNSASITSSCPYHYTSMSYNSAKSVSKATPCTNVPIHCPLCPTGRTGQPRTIWKYNVLFHLAKEHMDVDGERMPPIPLQLAVDMHISLEEETLMKVDRDVTEGWRIKHEIPGSDDIEQYSKEIEGSQDKKGKKRMRSQSNVVVERGTKSTRRR
ncbi:uncharacterized protein B0H18DRAFT_879325 [Fomitopsis serialis]|uniref:uncharacterized protein n=1 Tax=Fomitopsis serialis TaxID=139415 RepID=UPI00200797A0|nr:uncharacterized protein B0H18DRAFT_879325 [Neoantrodia serialis]KAH9922493.1 hypothetical protein B0H18DRAFT_879325 [Neoantrodia serialis]